MPSTNLSPELVDLLLSAEFIARQAGAVHKHYYRHPQQLSTQAKTNDYDIVTAADRAAERVVTDYVHRYHPGHAILSEESGDDHATSDWQWVIDPLDGTTNFSAGLPLFNVSIGIRYKGETVVGVVYAPILDEMFSAMRGQGAALNGQPIHPSDTTLLSHAVISTGFPSDKATTDDNNADSAARVMPRVRGFRRLGSAAIDICYVAAGFLDGYWEINLHEWDVCAGSLIATEAGATVTRYRNDRGISLMATTPALASQLLPLLRK